MYEGIIDSVSGILKTHGADILCDYEEFRALLLQEDPDSKSDYIIFEVALKHGVAGYFLNVPENRHIAVAEKVREKLKDMLAPKAVDVVIEAFARGLDWDDVVTVHSSAEKMYMLGENYFWGRNGYKQDGTKGIYWFELAAEKNHVMAQFFLGNCYYSCGAGVELSKAVEWFTRSAEQVDLSEQNKLGILYEEGAGVEKNLNKAFELYKKSAEQGLYASQYNLGDMYENGKGTEKDLIEAVRWYLKAHDQGCAAATEKLKQLLNI